VGGIRITEEHDLDALRKGCSVIRKPSPQSCKARNLNRTVDTLQP